MYQQQANIENQRNLASSAEPFPQPLESIYDEIDEIQTPPETPTRSDFYLDVQNYEISNDTKKTENQMGVNTSIDDGQESEQLESDNSSDEESVDDEHLQNTDQEYLQPYNSLKQDQEVQKYDSCEH